MEDQTTLAPKQKSNISHYLLALITLIIGVMIGFILFKEFPQTKLTNPNDTTNTQPKEITIPKDAVQIQACSDHQGSLFVEPQNIPEGPIYMVYKGKVIGIEFMLDLAHITQDQKYDFLATQDIHVNHAKLGYLSHGHQGNTQPHFHVDLYIVSKEMEESIKCANGSTEMNMPGMDMGGPTTTSQSANQPNMQMPNTTPTTSSTTQIKQ